MLEIENPPSKTKFFSRQEMVFQNFDLKSVKMKLRMITKKYAVDLVTQYPKKSIYRLWY